jgi:hypothetical protein
LAAGIDASGADARCGQSDIVRSTQSRGEAAAKCAAA